MMHLGPEWRGGEFEIDGGTTRSTSNIYLGQTGVLADQQHQIISSFENHNFTNSIY